MKMRACSWGCLSLLLGLIGVVPLWAQDGGNQGVQVLDEIAITATGTEVPLKETSTSTTIITGRTPG